MDECHRLAKSLKRLTRIRGQTDVRLNSSTRQLASDPRSQTAEPQNNRCDVAASCPHSISAKRLECCTDRMSLPARLLTKPTPIGLIPGAIMMGMIDVALCAAAIAEFKIATMTSGRS